MYMSTTLIATKLLASAGIALSLGGMGFAAAQNPTLQADMKAVETAITNKDFTAWKSASIQAATDRINATTEDQFNKLSNNVSQHKAAQEAIANNDYTAFKNSGDTKMLKRITTEDQFKQLVSDYQSRKSAQQAMNEAIKNNDFVAYKAAWSSLRSTFDENKDTQRTRPQPTDAELQTRFDALVKQYKADGSLPDADGFGPGIFGMGHWGRGMHGRWMDQDSSADQ